MSLDKVPAAEDTHTSNVNSADVNATALQQHADATANRPSTSAHVANSVAELSNIHYWGLGYYSVDQDGDIVVTPNPSQPTGSAKFTDIIAKVSAEKKSAFPLLFAFPQIIQHRLTSINEAFKAARQAYGYDGDYFLAYPIKVNQHRRVVESLITSGQQLGLEAGSKAELLAVISHARHTKTVIVCNGYKDAEYIRLALMAEKLGHKVFLVIEKISELYLVLNIAEQLGVSPRMGVRARLASQGAGKWQTSGGEKSKFGLSAVQVLEMVNHLKKHGLEDCLQLIHFHLGSQLGNIRDIATGVRESARFYAELHRMGVNIRYFDVGGGLGVDYDGNRTDSDCSTNYSLREYAETVVWGIGQICDEYELPYPTIITESGRATTAHHAVLVSNAIGCERSQVQELQKPAEDAPTALHNLWETWEEVCDKSTDRKSLRSVIHDIQFDLSDVHNQFVVGLCTLEQRAWAEQLYLNICDQVSKLFNPKHRHHRAVIDELQERFADKLYVNFSLFQSLPDAWGIDQLFPVVPLSLCDRPVARRAVLVDITCDSDGLIERYIDGDGIATTMPMPEYKIDEPPLLGFFMAGAYQEILGNMHNLFGDTQTVDVVIQPNGEIEVVDFDSGNTVEEMLKYVYLDPKVIVQSYRKQIEDSTLSASEAMQFMQTFETALKGYTYLEEDAE